MLRDFLTRAPADRLVRTIALAGACTAALAACDIEASDDPSSSTETGAPYDYQGPLPQEVLEERIAEHGILHAREDGSVDGALPPEVVLASLTTADGRELTFTWDSITNAIGYSELADEGSAQLFSRDVGILERYLALTTSDSPVPLPLIELDDSIDPDQRQELMGERETGFVVNARLTGTLPAANDDGVVAAASTNSCQSGTWFRDHHCWHENNNLVLRNFGSPIHACDNGGWTSLNRSTGNAARKNTHSTAVACDTDVRVSFKHKAFGTWWSVVDDQIIPDNKVYYRTRVTGAWWKRKIEYRRVGNSGNGFLRAESIFGN